VSAAKMLPMVELRWPDTESTPGVAGPVAPMPVLDPADAAAAIDAAAYLDLTEPWFTEDGCHELVLLPDNEWLNYDGDSDTVTLGVGTKGDVTLSLSAFRDLYPFVKRLIETGSMREPEQQAAPEPERVVVRGWGHDGRALEYGAGDDSDLAAQAKHDGRWWVWPCGEQYTFEQGTAPTRDLAGAQACAIEALKRLHPGLVVVAVDQVEEG